VRQERIPGQVVDVDEFNLGVIPGGPKGTPSNAAETVDSDAN
jgi:hypothetical protein